MSEVTDKPKMAGKIIIEKFNKLTATIKQMEFIFENKRSAKFEFHTQRQSLISKNDKKKNNVQLTVSREQQNQLFEYKLQSNRKKIIDFGYKAEEDKQNSIHEQFQKFKWTFLCKVLGRNVLILKISGGF